MASIYYLKNTNSIAVSLTNSSLNYCDLQLISLLHSESFKYNSHKKYIKFCAIFQINNNIYFNNFLQIMYQSKLRFSKKFFHLKPSDLKSLLSTIRFNRLSLKYAYLSSVSIIQKPFTIYRFLDLRVMLSEFMIKISRNESNLHLNAMHLTLLFLVPLICFKLSNIA